MSLLAIFSFMESYAQKPENEINYIPNKYIGKVAVVFNQPDGQKKEYTDSTRIYRIPPCGILKTQFADPKRVAYYSDEIDKDVVFVYSDATGHIYDTIRLLPPFERSETSAHNDFYLKNQDKIFIVDWGYGGFSFGDKKYDRVESYIIDTLKNRKRYSYMNFEKKDFDKCN